VHNPTIRGFAVAAVERAFGLVGDWLAPPACAACDAPLQRAAAFCRPCAETVEPAPSSNAVVAAFGFGGAIRTAILRLKYEGRADVARPLGLLLGQAVRASELRGDVVVPVPLHPARLAERGFNQAALLARHIAKDAGRLSCGLERVASRRRQASLGRDERLANLDGAFHASPSLRDKRVLLVDDVCTTGATFAACRSALREVGAASVVCVALAFTRA
jgi:ComF family protein